MVPKDPKRLAEVVANELVQGTDKQLWMLELTVEFTEDTRPEFTALSGPDGIDGQRAVIYTQTVTHRP